MSALPKGNIGWTTTGLPQVIQALTAIQLDIPFVGQAMRNEAARFFVNEAKRNVHVVSGRLKGSISIDPLQPPYEIRVSAKTSYAGKENRRQGEKAKRPKSLPPYGPHNYFDLAAQATETLYSSRIKTVFDDVWKKHRTR